MTKTKTGLPRRDRHSIVIVICMMVMFSDTFSKIIILYHLLSCLSNCINKTDTGIEQEELFKSLLQKLSHFYVLEALFVSLSVILDRLS